MFDSLVNVTRIGTREFLRAGRYVIPVVQIREFYLYPREDPECDVTIVADDEESYSFKGEVARKLVELFGPSVGEVVKPGPAGLIADIERIIDILHDSRSRGHGARIEVAGEALQELRRRLIAGETTGGDAP